MCASIHGVAAIQGMFQMVHTSRDVVYFVFHVTLPPAVRTPTSWIQIM